MSPPPEYGEDAGYTAHVDAIRKMKADIQQVRRDLDAAYFSAGTMNVSVAGAVGQPPAQGQWEPESARILRIWAKDTLEEINRLILGMDNMNEEADAYLRLIGG